MHAVVVAQRSAKAFAARHGTRLGGLEVRRRLQPVRKEHVDDPVVGAVVQLPGHGLFLVFVPQVAAVLLVEPGQRVVLNRVDGHNPRRGPIVEGRALHETLGNLVPLGALHIHLHEIVRRPLGRPLPVAAPARMRVAQVAPPAIARDPTGAILLWGAMRVVHANSALLPPFNKGRPVQRMHQLPRHGRRQLHMGLLELPARDMHAQALRKARRMPAEEGADIRLQAVVG
mmetsp:Transcript_20241/g.60640  ORF Transcript_20241/g.60640 Transcript_20241/m.60640 type:complete len:229 (-) Transcript_20241:537-1223(-)